MNSESQPHLAAVYSVIEDKDTMADEEPTRYESVWDYPRPPRLESTTRHLRVVHAGIVLAETCRGLRILETSHPPRQDAQINYLDILAIFVKQTTYLATLPTFGHLARSLPAPEKFEKDET